MLSREATNINSKVFDLTRPGLEPTIYCTLSEHANHYATDAVCVPELTRLYGHKTVEYEFRTQYSIISQSELFIYMIQCSDCLFFEYEFRTQYFIISQSELFIYMIQCSDWLFFEYEYCTKKNMLKMLYVG